MSIPAARRARAAGSCDAVEARARGDDGALPVGGVSGPIAREERQKSAHLLLGDAVALQWQPQPQWQWQQEP